MNSLNEEGWKDEEPSSTPELVNLHKLIQDCCEKIGEFSDSVQIFATVKSPHTDGTSYISNGRGNYYARYGQVKLWVNKEEFNDKRG